MTCATVFPTQENQNIFPLEHITYSLLGLPCVGAEVRSHSEIFAQSERDESIEFISLLT